MRQTVRDTLQLYMRYAGISIRGQMEYRGSFVMQSMGQFLIVGIEFLAVWALFDRFGSLRGWTLPEVALLYGMVNVSFALAEAVGRGFTMFPEVIKAGDFDRILLRPRGTVLQVAGKEFTMRRIGRVLQGAFVLAWAVWDLDLALAPARLGLLLAAIAGGICFFYGLFILQAVAAFWTTESLEVFHIFTYGGTAAAQYPMSIYRPWFRRIFTYVIPLAAVNYIPALGILGRGSSTGAWAFLPWLAPFLCVGFLLVSLQVWHVGVRHYTSTGS
jgi:ABC-2 type transport system permease protein